jgi:hypothetical protein
MCNRMAERLKALDSHSSLISKQRKCIPLKVRVVLAHQSTASLGMPDRLFTGIGIYKMPQKRLQRATQGVIPINFSFTLLLSPNGNFLTLSTIAYRTEWITNGYSDASAKSKC